MSLPPSRLVCASLLLVAAIVCVVPVVSLSAWSVAQPAGHAALWGALRDPALLLRSCAIAGGIAFGAVLLAWPTAWWVRSRQSFSMFVLMVPLLLPTYFVSSSYGLLRAPGTWLGDLVAQSSPAVIRSVVATQAIGGLVLWSWPIATLVLLLAIRSIPQEQLDALHVSTGSCWKRNRLTASLLKNGLVTSWLVVGMFMLGSAVPLHIAGLPTYTIELWRVLDEQPGPAAAWGMSLPILLVAVFVGVIVIRGVDAKPNRSTYTEQTHPTKSLGILTWCIWSAAVLIPLAALLYSLRSWSSVPAVLGTNSGAWATSATTALCVVALSLGMGLLASAGLAGLWQSVSSRAVRASALLWVILAFVPGVLVGSSILNLALNYPAFYWLAQSQWGVIVAHVSRFACLTVLAAIVLRAWEPADLTAMRTMERDSVRVWLRTTLRPQLPWLCAAALATGMFSLHEIESAVVLMQPGADNLPRPLLNMLHYNRVQELIASVLVLLVTGLIAAMLLGWIGNRSIRNASRRTAAFLFLGSCSVFLVSCGNDSPHQAGTLPNMKILGEPGRSPGQFIKPRCIDSDGQSIWVIDRSGRVQRLDAAGEPTLQWELPTYEKGFPTGMTIGRDGTLYIADTHEHSILVCRILEDEIEVIQRVGSYGQGDGQFIYPTDVAIQTLPDGITPKRFYVSEYGGNDRVSVFDHEWNFLFSFGREGSSADVDDIAFCRPQSLLFDQERSELLVADACNHRLGRFSSDGTLLEWIGIEAGSDPGSFRYPYGLTNLDDGSVLVVEFGNNRVQRVEWEGGLSLGIYGRTGRDAAGLTEPWSCAVLGTSVYVLDTGKHRIVSFDVPVFPEVSAQ